MKGLIQKSGYIKPGSGGGHYAEYIATRDGVELMEPTTSGGYLEYIAERPRSHGLFSADGAADLEQTMEEINAHAGPVWTFIYSLKREDAARLGYENGESWRRLLLAHQTELATAMKIPPSSFRWCAAFHDEKHHPHIHMMAWCADPKQGYLTEKGIEQMRSQLSNDIFQDALLSLYQEKDLSYQQVRDAAMEAMGRLIREMKSGLCDSPVIAGQMETLAGILTEVKGKKMYGYLTNAAREGNQYAQYTLGKLYLTGEDVARDQEQAYRWFWESASQGNEYSQFFLDHFNDNHSPNVLLSATKLLHHMGRIFQDNSIPPCPPGSHRTDRKLLQKIRQKKIALGHKPDDHEEEQNMGGMTMGGM